LVYNNIILAAWLRFTIKAMDYGDAHNMCATLSEKTNRKQMLPKT